MKKVLIIQEVLSNYNIPLFLELSKLYDLDLIVTEAPKKNVDLNIIVIKKKNFFGFYLFEENINKYFKDHDVIICSPNFQYINLLFISILHRKKVIYYGIGVVASYKNSYDSKKWITYLFSKYLKLISATIFYSPYPKEKYNKLNVDEKKMFVANNSLKLMIDEVSTIDKKNSILFVGSLYKEKGLQELLELYNSAYLLNKNIPCLNIIGEGTERVFIESFVRANNLQEKVFLIGEIYDEEVLKEYFNQAIFCVSLRQAGLSVVKSMAYGVPFITMHNSITGGEIFNIRNNENGLILSNKEELIEIIKYAESNKITYYKYGISAQEHYLKYCSFENMVNGFRDAISYCLRKQSNI